MLYTTIWGERRIRVFNMNLQIVKTLNGYFKTADVETLSQFIIRREATKIMVKGSVNSKQSLINGLVDLLFTYRQKCATQSSPTQLILPDNLKLLPLYNLSALKNPVSIFSIDYEYRLSKCFKTQSLMRRFIKCIRYLRCPWICSLTSSTHASTRSLMLDLKMPPGVSIQRDHRSWLNQSAAQLQWKKSDQKMPT